MNGWACRPPSPPRKEISSSNAEPLQFRIVEAVDDDVGHVLKPVGPAQVGGRTGREWGERVLALDEVAVQVSHPGRAEHDRTPLARAHEWEADVGMVTQGREQARVALLDLLDGQPSRLLHQVDEPQVPDASTIASAAPRLSRARPRMAASLGTTGRLRHRAPHGGVALIGPHRRPR